MRRELWILSLLLICLALVGGIFFARAINPKTDAEQPAQAPPVADTSPRAADVPNPTAPLIEWDFDRAAGNLVPDATGHGYDAHLHGGAQLAPGWGGRQVLSFDGSGDNSFWHDQTQNCGLSIEKRLDRSFDALTVEAWVRKDPAGWMPVIYRGKWDEESGFGLYMEWSSGKATFGHYCYDTNKSGVQAEHVVQDGHWHQVVGVMAPAGDGSHVYRIFVDGELDAEQTGSWGVAEAPNDGGILMIAYPNSSGADFPFKGDLARVALFDVALTPEMVKARFDAQRPQ